MSDDLDVIYSAANAQQAEILRGILADEGISAQVSNIALEGAQGGLALGWSTSPCVMVRKVDAEIARQIAVDFDRDLIAGRDEPLFDKAKSSFAWPICPRCAKRRVAVCAHCGDTDDEMTPAEFLVSDSVSHGVGSDATTSFEMRSADNELLCSVCDKTFVPQYLSGCSDCGYEFGDGIRRERGEAAESIDPRAIVVIVAIVGLAIAASVYFWWIAQ